MIIESLFPEVANLYGDPFNVKYLKQCLPQATFVDTSLSDEPRFAKEEVAMIYMGPMTERSQELVIEKLMTYKERIQELIEKGTLFLITGNAMEVFGNFIETEDGKRISGLGIFSIYAKRRMFTRYNSLFLGKLEQMKIVGFKNQFSHSYGDNTQEGYFCEVIRGDGLNPDSKLEGIRKHNFFGTYLLGPILVMNPEFTKYILQMLGVTGAVVAFEEEVRKAFELRLAEFEDEKVKL